MAVANTLVPIRANIYIKVLVDIYLNKSHTPNNYFFKYRLEESHNV